MRSNLDPRRTRSGILRRALRVAVVAALLGLCLFGDCEAVRITGALSGVVGELTAAFSDAGTQWMVFVCAGMYFVMLTVLRQRRGKPPAGEHRGWRMEEREDGGSRMGEGADGGLRIEGGVGAALLWLRNPTVWLAGLLAFAAVAYVLHYADAARSTQALTLLGGAVVGQGAAVWAGRRKKEEGRTGIGGTVVGVLIVLLVAAAMWRGETGHFFQYRGEARWSGPWDNPNTFGMLMGVGMVLALGSLKAKVQSLKSWGGEHRTANVEHRTLNCWWWLRGALLVAAAGVMGVGLVRSYSRGAWVGTVVAVGCLGWQMLKGEMLRAEIGDGRLREPEHRRVNTERRTLNRMAVAVILVSLGVVGFWGFRQAEGAVARRAYSVANANDFSWQKRMAAYEAALQMMADRPWFGFGWNQPERVYDRYYRAAKVDEGMAIQLNDYLMLGMTLGVPALCFFVVYVALALAAPRRTSKIEHRTSNLERGASDSGRWALDLAAVCRAGAVVLLVGFWFDGGLFKLATGATFWVLLELGRADLTTDD